jgi:hypothetical protein
MGGASEAKELRSSSFIINTFTHTLQALYTAAFRRLEPLWLTALWAIIEQLADNRN